MTKLQCRGVCFEELSENLKQYFLSTVQFGDALSCWEWQGKPSTSGYGYIYSNRKCYLAHRVAYVYWNDNIPDGLYVCHSCDNKICCNPDHLFLGTARDNGLDASKKGLANTPNREGYVSGANLTWEQVHAIRNKFSSGLAEELAEEYGVNRQTIYNIVTKKVWRKPYEHENKLGVKRGESHSMAVLTEADVKTIRLLAASGVKKTELALQYSCSKNCIQSVVQRRTWKHVD